MVVLLCDLALRDRWASQGRTFAALEPYVDEVIDVNSGDLSRLAGADVVSFGWFRFCSRLDALGEAMKSCTRLIQVVTDYEHPPVTQVRRAIEGKPNVAISNIRDPLPGKSWSWATEWYYLNWNLLGWIGVQERVYSRTQPGLLYYGRWRNKRAAYFERFLGFGCGYRVNVSTGPRVIEKFTEMNPSIVEFQRFTSLSELQQFEYAIYIEDTFTHTHYNSPANRFYECLAWGIPQLFDQSCLGTFKEAGIDITPWIVDRDEVPMFLDQEPEIHIERQRRRWISDWGSEFRKELLTTMAVIL